MMIWLLLLSCAPKIAVLDRSQTPEALAPRAFQLPEVTTGHLSNGIPVTVVENHEVPLVNIRVAFDQGEWTDDVAHPGLADVTLDMMNEGAGEYDAAALSKAVRTLASSVSSSAGEDTASVRMQSLSKNVEPTLDLFTTVLLQPTFPEDEWSLMFKKRLADLEAARNNPRSISGRVRNQLLYGDSYAGLLRTEAGYSAIDTDAMRQWRAKHLVPSNARIFVGGDTTLEAIQPLLEARLGSWRGEAEVQTKPADGLANVEQTTLFLVDKPGAPQSVLQVFQRLELERTDADYFDAVMANMMYGGMFSARINMNLREDKGWTYGARSSMSTSYAPVVWNCSTSVKTDTTQGSISEILREIDESRSTRPFSADELAASRGYLLGSRPVRFEQPSYLLGEIQDIWVYGLVDDWVTGYADRVRSVTVESAQAAWNRLIDPDRLSILVVGDAATIRTGLETLGLPIVVLDANGNRSEESE